MIAFIIALFGIGLAVIVPIFGSIRAVGNLGEMSSGVMMEEPQLFGKLLLLTALPGTQGIYGFLAGFIGIVKLGLLGGGPEAQWIILKNSGSIWDGIQFLLACLTIVLAGYFSAIVQGHVCASGIKLTTKQPDAGGKGLVLGVFIEFYAILGLLTSILLINSIQY
ncbi:V-type ATP synthase subunit K [bacterium]|nr:V-type ATP synthase subunit K [bacterium]